MELERKLKDAMIDPSLLYRYRFWGETPPRNIKFYIPKILYKIPENDIPDFSKFYMGGLSQKRALSFKEIKEMLAERKIEEFDRKKYIKKIPEQFLERYEILQNLDFKYPIKEVLLDEFVFLTTKSCLLSALKKVFKQFEKINVFPLINLEEKVPDEWKETVSGLKKLANWIAFLGTFTLTGNLILSGVSAKVTEGIRLFLIDP